MVTSLSGFGRQTVWGSESSMEWQRSRKFCYVKASSLCMKYREKGIHYNAVQICGDCKCIPWEELCMEVLGDP